MMRLSILSLALMSSSPGAAVAEHLSGDLPMPSAELLAKPTRHSTPSSLHPPVVLRDEKGAPVLSSGGPVSAAKTCDGCHDVSWIRKHDGHRETGRMEKHDGYLGAGGPEDDRTLATSVGGNCFLCHVGAADNQARLGAIGNEEYDLVETATLAGTGLVEKEGDEWRWHQESFQADGTVASARLGLGRPGSRACGFCHGTVYEDTAPLSLTTDASQRMTDRQGIVFSGQRISDSAVNLAGKSSLFRPWDVHAERLLSCASCHFSPNHPAYSFSKTGPTHLQFDARRVSIAEYLRRPDHRLAKGATKGASSESPQDASLRRCENCHDAPSTHRWLPRAELHLGVLLCEACHVPMTYAPARQEIDWTMLSAKHEPRVTYRGGDPQGFVTGSRPALLWRSCADGSRKLAPNNLTTRYAWVQRGDGKRRYVDLNTLRTAFFDKDVHRPELVKALDRNRDGKLEDEEIVLDNAEKVNVARDLLIAAGVEAPELTTEVVPQEIHHGVSPGAYAVRECSSCHTADSRLGEPTLVSTVAPFGATVRWSADFAGDSSGSLVRDGQGRVWFRPVLAGVHVLGHTRRRWLDWLGVLLVFGAFVGAGFHGFLRIRAARRHGKEKS